MMKPLISLTAALLLGSAAFAQNKPGASSANDSTAVATDTVTVTVATSTDATTIKVDNTSDVSSLPFSTISVDSEGIRLDEGETATIPQIGMEEGRWTLRYDGRTYVISDLAEADEFLSETGDFENADIDTLILRENMGYATIIIAIIFGFPCLAIVAALAVILAYTLKRNRGRNQIINNAIDHDYQLPDSFYLNQKPGGTEGAPTRDSRKFYTAVSLIAVGLSVIVFGFAIDAPFFYLAGGIPFLIGIGQMFGYYCVPNTRPKMDPRGFYTQTPYTQPQTPYAQPQTPYGQPQAPYCQPQPPFEQPQPPFEQPTPPPFNGIRR